MPRLTRLLFLPLLLVAGLLHAQSVRWEPASGTLPRDQVSQLSLIFEDAEPKDPPAPPKVDGLAFLGTPGRSEQNSFNLSFGAKAVRRSTVIYTFAVRPTRSDGEVRVPAFAVETDAGRLTVPPAGFRIAAATVGNSGLTLDQVARTRLALSTPTVWAGEVFSLNHVLEVNRDHQFRSADTLTWNNQSVVAEPWGEPVRASGATTSTETRATRAMAASPGNREIGTVSQEVIIATGVNMFGQAVGSSYTLTTDPFPLEVRPLPSPAPADFVGAVGKFTLRSKVVPEKAAVGEPVTWTLVLEGMGNWPAIDKLLPRSLARDFRVVAPRAQKTPKPDTLFEATLTEDLVLIPQKPGRTTLGPYTLSVFNPATGAYETLRTEPVSLEITGSASAPVPDVSPSAAPPASAADSASANPPLPPPTAPGPVAKLPADPLPPGLLSAAPRAAWPRALFWTPLALVLPLVFWVLLAARHARRQDPLRSRRAAHEELRRILSRLESGTSGGTPSPASAPATAADLLAWQHAARALFDLPSATPSARDLPDPVWAALWIEVDRALYRPATPLAKEWFAQAWEAHARATPPARSPLAALRPAHLFARAALWTLVVAAPFAAGSSLLAAPADALASYARGDFPAAEASLRPAVAGAPLDAALRHNLALALAQQGNWGEAAAHAYAAALQHPGDAALERLFAATAPKAGYRIQLPPTAARLLPVRGWQTLALVAALALLALAPAAYLAALHSPGSRRALLGAGHGVLGVALLALAAALLALRAHGPAAAPDAVLVWRAATLRAVPTDAGEQKVVAELPAGTLARVDKEFLGWRRVVLPDGNTGWVRAEPLVALWR